MTTLRQEFTGTIHKVAAVVIVGLLAWSAPRAVAAPFTSNFDDLIADLQAREGTLSNSVDKTQQKQFKTIEKVLGTLDGKDSTSLATDIKNLGSIAKTLIKAFPTDYTPPGSSLLTNTETALDGLIDDVQTAINTTETNANALTASCASKAQASVNAAQTDLDDASAATDIPTAAKLLGTALKAETKADAAVTKCSTQVNGGGGGGGGGGGNGLGDTLSATVSGSVNLNFSAVMGPNGIVAAGQYHPVNIITIEAAYAPGGAGVVQQSMILYVDNVTGPGTYPIDFGSQLDDEAAQPQIYFLGAEGTITFTTADLVNQKLVGTFAFTAPEVGSNAAMVTVTGGQFNISRIPTIPVKVPTNTNFMTATDNGFAFWGSCTGEFTTNGFANKLLITGENTLVTARTITLVLDNPTATGVAYPVGAGSLYTDEHNISTIYQDNSSGTVVFSALDIPAGIAEGTFTFSVTQSTPPGTNTVNVINGHFKQNNIVTN